MDTFLQIYQSYVRDLNNIQIKKSLYDIIHRLENQNQLSIDQKERIYVNMITSNPEDVVLYHKIGSIFKDNCKEKTILWWRLGHEREPTNKLIFLDFIELLYNMTYYDIILSLNKNNLFDKMLGEPRFLTIYTRLQLMKMNYKDGLKNLLALINIRAPKKCITYKEKFEKWSNYHDIGYVFSALCDHENAMKYTKKASELANKFQLTLFNRLLSFQNVLSFSNHIYVDNAEFFNTCLKINDYLRDQPIFSFNPSSKKKIKIGYLSSDFIQHAISNFIFPILKNHDKTKFDIVLFSNIYPVEPIYQSLGLPIYYIHDKDAKTVANQIYDLNVDILMDLNGHTANNFMEIFTYHPAPIQIAYLGYPNTTGLKAIEYRLTDAIADPLHSTQQYSEMLIRLPRCFLLFESIHPFVIGYKPTDPRKIILGSINRENKTNDEVLTLWRQILKECRNTVILIKLESFDNVNEREKYYCQVLEIPPDRIIILPKLQNDDYCQLFTKFDILLDPFPYSGTTTTCNSLLNSVPVITLYHSNYHAHNVSSSILINADLPELVAYSKQQYKDIIKDLANNPYKIDHYKKTIRQKFMKSMEPKPFMTSYEKNLVDLYHSFYSKKIEIPVKESVEIPIKESIEIPIKESIEIPIKESNEIPVKESIEIPIKESNVYICGCVKNCENYIESVFKNIEKIAKLFDHCKIIIAFDDPNDKTIEILKQKPNVEFLFVSENSKITEYNMRTIRLANARNKIIDYIKKENDTTYEYFIMMDMDDVNIDPINTEVLKYYLYDNVDWDTLSFNRKDYYDIWALSIEPCFTSCWHFPNYYSVIPFIKEYITRQLAKLQSNELLPCISAFNGFAIYRKKSFVHCYYDGTIEKTLGMFSKEQIEQNEKAMRSNITKNVSYHPIIHPTTDCEHRHFHRMAEKQGAKIRISPRYLFMKEEDVDYDQYVKVQVK